MKKHLMHRSATAALFAAVACFNAPVFAQDVPAASQPPVVDVAPPPPVVAAPPPVAAAPPPVVTPAPAPAPVATRTVRTAPRAAAPAPVRHAAPARAAARAAAPVAAPAPAPVVAEPAPPPVAAASPPAPVPAATPVPVRTQSTATQSRLTMLWPWLLGAGIVILGAIFLLARRRRRDEVYEEEYYEEPVAVAAPEPSFVRAAPVAAEPVEAAAAEVVSVSDADSADVDAMAADSRPAANRPWLELLMRPIRAGTSKDDAIVQFELTVGNTGSVGAEHVQISTWMVAGGQASDMEHMLIDRPADATVSEVDIAAGDGTIVEAEVALSKAGMHEPVLPVVVADARYRLPDGSEGRTSASFAVGLPAQAEGGALEPFPIDRASGLRENVEARLHGEPERV
jgi:LPXTG-motif cell wall-anchored protein